MNYSRFTLSVCTLMALFSSCGKDDVPKNSNQEISLNSEIYLPPNYDSTRTYPLVIFNDGEVVFNGWKINELFDSLIQNDEIRPAIVVAVAAQNKRLERYIPYRDAWVNQNWGSYTPKARQYTSELINGLIPTLQKSYSINTDSVALFGASLGGLHAIWAALEFPKVFKFGAGLSPSLWVADHAIFDEPAEFNENGIWLDIGTREWNYYVPLYEKLTRNGFEEGKNCFYYEVEGGMHTDFAWLERMAYPVKAFLSKQSFEPVQMEAKLECIQSASNPQRYFRRINPVLTLANGIKYSLAHKARYTNTLHIDEELNDDGSFFALSQPTRIVVAYKEFRREVLIDEDFCP